METRRKKKRAKCCQAREKSAAIVRSVGYSEWGTGEEETFILPNIVWVHCSPHLLEEPYFISRVTIPDVKEHRNCLTIIIPQSLCWSCFEKTSIVLEQRTNDLKKWVSWGLAAFKSHDVRRRNLLSVAHSRLSLSSLSSLSFLRRKACQLVLRGWAYNVILLSATAFTIQNILPLKPFLIQQLWCINDKHFNYE